MTTLFTSLVIEFDICKRLLRHAPPSPLSPSSLPLFSLFVLLYHLFNDPFISYVSRISLAYCYYRMTGNNPTTASLSERLSAFLIEVKQLETEHKVFLFFFLFGFSLRPPSIVSHFSHFNFSSTLFYVCIGMDHSVSKPREGTSAIREDKHRYVSSRENKKKNIK